MKIIILHGLGQNTSDWITFSEFLDTPSHVLSLFENIDEKSTVNIGGLEKKVAEELNDIREPFILIGLSLGGYLALNYVSNNNNSYLKKMIVCGAIYKPIPFITPIVKLS